MKTAQAGGFGDRMAACADVCGKMAPYDALDGLIYHLRLIPDRTQRSLETLPPLTTSACGIPHISLSKKTGWSRAFSDRYGSMGKGDARCRNAGKWIEIW